MNLEKILIKQISSKLPNLLKNKLSTLGIQNIQELIDLDIESFSEIKGVGKAVVNQLCNAQNWLQLDLLLNPKWYDGKFENSKFEILILPQDNEINDNIFEKLKRCIDEYLVILKKSDYRKFDIIQRYYGFNGFHPNSLQYIGARYELSRERIRQVFNIVKFDLYELFQQKESSKLKVKFSTDLLDNLQVVQDKMKEFRIFTKTKFEDYLFQTHHIKISNDEFNYVKLYFDVFKIIQVRGASIYFYKENPIYNSGVSKNGNDILIICKNIFDFLSGHALPVSESEIITHLHNNFEHLEDSEIRAYLNAFPEIEAKIIDVQPHYVIRTDWLNSMDLIAERILFENGKPMNFHDIKNEILKIYTFFAVQKPLTDNSLRSSLIKKKHIHAIGNTRFYALTSWDYNYVSLIHQIKLVLLKYNEPLSQKFIFDEVLKLNSQLNKRSVISTIYTRLIRLNNNLYILPEWENQFKDIIYDCRGFVKSNQKNSFVWELINNTENKEIPFSELNQKLENKGWTYKNIHNVLNSKRYFEKYTKNHIVYIAIKGFVSPSKNKNIETISNLSFNYFESLNANRVKLSKLVNHLAEIINKPNPYIYKLIIRVPNIKKVTIDDVLFAEWQFI